MKKIVFFFFIIFTLSFVTNVNASTGLPCDLEQALEGDTEMYYNECTHLTITNANNIDKIKNFNSIIAVTLKNDVFEDISFINDLDISELSFYAARVNVDKINTDKIKQITIDYSQVENDNYGAFVNTPNLEELFINGYFNTLDSIKKLSSLTSLKILSVHNMGKIFDTTPLLSLTNLESLFLPEEYYTADVVNFLNENNINTQPMDFEENMNNIKLVDELFASIDLEGLTDLQKIVKISNFINDYTHYATDTDEQKNSSLEYLLAGYGVCSNYAHMTTYFLNKAGFIAYTLTGEGYIDTYTNSFMNHAWNEVYYNGKWYSIDNTWTDGQTVTEEGVLEHVYPYFMVDPKDEQFYASLYHHPYVDMYVNTDFKININYVTNSDIEKESDIISVGEKFIPKEISREGYEFAGWYLDNDLTTPYNSNEYINYDTITLYAKWNKLGTSEQETKEEKNNLIVINPNTSAFNGIILVIISNILILVTYYVMHNKKNMLKRYK